MPYVLVSPATRAEIDAVAEGRWTAIVADRPELDGAVDLQRKLIERVISAEPDARRRPAAAPVAAGQVYRREAGSRRAGAGWRADPAPCRGPHRALLGLCGDLAAGGAGEAAEHIRTAVQDGSLDAGSLLAASLSRDQDAIRTGAVHRGLASDLVWLVAELAVGPFAYVLQRALFGSAVSTRPTRSDPGPIAAALDNWNHGYCPACGSWPAMAEVVDGHRVLRCSFCAAAWELTTYACVYCGEEGEPFVTAAPDEERKDRRVEVCSGCSGYLKTVDAFALSPFPLLSIGDLETMDLDMAAMEHGYHRPPLKEFGTKR